MNIHAKLHPLAEYRAITDIEGESINIKDKDYCPLEIIKGLTDKGQF